MNQQTIESIKSLRMYLAQVSGYCSELNDLFLGQYPEWLPQHSDQKAKLDTWIAALDAVEMELITRAKQAELAKLLEDGESAK